MNRYVIPPEMPRPARNSGAYTSTSMPYGDLELPDLHSDELRRWREITPPPPDQYVLATEAIVSREPFDHDDGSSVSSRNSAFVRQRHADAMLHHPTVVSSQKHPVVDCALNVYASALQRAAGHFQASEPSTDANLARWRSVCALVRTDFFIYRQQPPLASNYAESARFTAWLKEKSFLKHDPDHPQDTWGLAYKELTTEQLLAACRADGFEHNMFEPHRLRMAVVALNTVYDAGCYEFFELKAMYGFRLGQNSAPQTPFKKVPETTEEACKARAGGGHVKSSMIQLRISQVAERKRKIAAEIAGYTVAHQTAWANNFI